MAAWLAATLSRETGAFFCEALLMHLSRLGMILRSVAPQASRSMVQVMVHSLLRQRARTTEAGTFFR